MKNTILISIITSLVTYLAIFNTLLVFFLLLWVSLGYLGVRIFETFDDIKPIIPMKILMCSAGPFGLISSGIIFSGEIINFLKHNKLKIFWEPRE